MMREIKQEEISVELLDYMGSDIRVNNVAKVSFNKWDEEDAEINEKQIGLLNYLATGLPSSERDDWEKRAKASTHFSPFCHAFLTVRCAAPIFLTRQLVKHQIGLSWNEESRRYITEDVNLWLPESVHKKPESAKQGASKEVHKDPVIVEYENGYYTSPSARYLMVDSSEASVRAYYGLLAGGVAPEEARIVLPLNSMTHWIWSGSLMAFMRVAKQRVDGHAQNAAQEFAKKLLATMEFTFPESLKAFGLIQE